MMINLDKILIIKSHRDAHNKEKKVWVPGIFLFY